MMATDFSVAPVTDPEIAPRTWPPPRRRITEPLVVAFAASSLRDVVRADVVRRLLASTMDTMTRVQGTVHLAPFWRELKTLPGFSVEKGAEAIARYKSFELTLGYTVQLPEELASWGSTALEAAAARAPVSALQLLDAMDPPRVTPSHPLPSLRQRQKKSRARLRRTGIVVGITLLTMLITPLAMDLVEDRVVEAASISTEIPLRSARVISDGMELRLRDDGWLRAPDREAALLQALKNAQAAGVSKLAVLDSTGTLRAVALVVDNQPRATFID